MEPTCHFSTPGTDGGAGRDSRDGKTLRALGKVTPSLTFTPARADGVLSPGGFPPVPTSLSISTTLLRASAGRRLGDETVRRRVNICYAGGGRGRGSGAVPGERSGAPPNPPGPARLGPARPSAASAAGCSRRRPAGAGKEPERGGGDARSTEGSLPPPSPQRLASGWEKREDEGTKKQS